MQNLLLSEKSKLQNGMESMFSCVHVCTYIYKYRNILINRHIYINVYTVIHMYVGMSVSRQIDTCICPYLHRKFPKVLKK